MSTIFNEIQAEREYQVQRWGTAMDDQNTNANWANYISHYANRNLIGVLGSESDVDFRVSMIKVAALAIAAIEALDRRGN